MNNLILYKGGSTFLLLQNVPEIPTKSFEAAHYVSAEHEYLQALDEYEQALEACEESAKEIINEEFLPLYFGEGGDVYLQTDKGETLLKPGDTFPLPDNILFKEEFQDAKMFPGSGMWTKPSTIIRLYASKEEDSIISAMTRAQFGDPYQIDIIQLHMEEYFKRWPNYKEKFNHLEWHHIYLDFMDTIEKHFTIQRKKP